MGLGRFVGGGCVEEVFVVAVPQGVDVVARLGEHRQRPRRRILRDRFDLFVGWRR
jgi:hypothetical protein